MMERERKGGAVVSVTGNHQAVIDGCDGIIDYDDETVIARTGRLTLRITGRDLRLTRLTETSAVIQGRIAGLEYSY